MQQARALQAYLERQHAEFHTSMAALELQLADASYKAIQKRMMELQYEALNS